MSKESRPTSGLSTESSSCRISRRGTSSWKSPFGWAWCPDGIRPKSVERLCPVPTNRRPIACAGSRKLILRRPPSGNDPISGGAVPVIHGGAPAMSAAIPPASSRGSMFVRALPATTHDFAQTKHQAQIGSRADAISTPLHFTLGDLRADIEGDAHAEIGESGVHRGLQGCAVLGLGQLLLECDQIRSGVLNA